MKKIISVLAATVCIAGIMFSSCRSAGEKVENAENKLQEAKKDVVEANRDLFIARQDSITEYQLFKRKYDEKIIAHNKIIADFKARIADEKDENKAAYEKKLAELEQKNTDLKRVLDEYKNEKQNNWEFFKTEFTKDMNKLSEAFNDLVNKK